MTFRLTPLNVACSNCQSPENKPCTQPTDTGRKPVQWFHAAREEAVRKLEEDREASQD